jgi:hypothetical protein
VESENVVTASMLEAMIDNRLSTADAPEIEGPRLRHIARPATCPSNAAHQPTSNPMMIAR